MSFVFNSDNSKDMSFLINNFEFALIPGILHLCPLKSPSVFSTLSVLPGAPGGKSEVGALSLGEILDSFMLIWEVL